jgi:hypothetical protein
MPYNYEQFLHDHGINFDPQNSRGYLSLQCPFCSDSGKHMGLHSEKSSGYCWKCGGHPIDTVVKIMTGEDWWKIKNQYEIGIIPGKEIVPGSDCLVLPYGIAPLSFEQIEYLKRRKFDPDMLIRKYKILGTKHIGDYNFRIIIPIIYNGRPVSYLGRDYTELSPIRYKVCEIKDEVIHHKHILYNMDNCPGEHAVVVEGCTDVWRLGDGSIATMGTGWTTRQVNLLAKRYKRITLLFDAGADAVARAENLGNNLSGVGLDVEIISLREGDPGSLPQNEADDIMKHIINKNEVRK